MVEKPSSGGMSRSKGMSEGGSTHARQDAPRGASGQERASGYDPQAGSQQRSGASQSAQNTQGAESVGNGLHQGLSRAANASGSDTAKYAADRASFNSKSAVQQNQQAMQSARDGKYTDALAQGAAANGGIYGKAANEAYEAGKLLNKQADKQADLILGKDPKASGSEDSGTGISGNRQGSSASGARGVGKSKSDEGLTGKKLAGSAGAGAGAGVGAQAAFLMVMLNWLKFLFMQFLAAARNLLQLLLQWVLSVFHAVTGFFSSIGASIAVMTNGFVSSSVATLSSWLTAAVVSVTAVVGGAAAVQAPAETAQRDAMLQDCSAQVRQAVAGLNSTDANSAGSANKASMEENAKRIYELFAGMGMSKENIAGILGNWQNESTVDPTAVETIFNEPHTIGPKKKAAADAKFLISAIDSSYAARFPNIHQAGIGLGQWTNERNVLLQAYAKKINKPWYSIDTQIGFMVSADDSTRVGMVKDMIKNPAGSPESAAAKFQSGWEGLTALDTNGERGANAKVWMGKFGNWKADKSGADSLLKQSGADLSKDTSGTNASNDAQTNGVQNAADLCADNASATVALGNGTLGKDATGEHGLHLSGTVGTPYKWDQVPANLKKYAIDPRSVGLDHLNCKNWTQYTGTGSSALNGQCVALSKAMFSEFWLKNGKHAPIGNCNGFQCSGAFASANGGKVSKTPKAGAVAGVNNGGAFGHTYVVSHVFANGDIMVVEQNFTGYSGWDSMAQECSWNYRVIPKSGYESENATFFAPDGYSVNPKLKALG